MREANQGERMRTSEKNSTNLKTCTVRNSPPEVKIKKNRFSFLLTLNLLLAVSIFDSGCSIFVRTSTAKVAASAPVTCSSSATLFGGGSGTSSDPYAICTATDLDNIRNYLSSNFILANDLDLTGVTLYPIPRPGVFDPMSGTLPTGGFAGTFDGNNHTISNWTTSGSSDSMVGLFGFSSGTIKNLTIKDFSADLRTFNLAGGFQCTQFGIPCFVYGGLVGFNSGSLSNINLITSKAIQIDAGNTNALMPLSIAGLVGFQSGGTLDTITGTVTSGFSVTGFIASGLIGIIQSGSTVS